MEEEVPRVVFTFVMVAITECVFQNDLGWPCGGVLHGVLVRAAASVVFRFC